MTLFDFISTQLELSNILFAPIRFFSTRKGFDFNDTIICIDRNKTRDEPANVLPEGNISSYTIKIVSAIVNLMHQEIIAGTKRFIDN